MTSHRSDSPEAGAEMVTIARSHCMLLPWLLSEVEKGNKKTKTLLKKLALHLVFDT